MWTVEFWINHRNENVVETQFKALKGRKEDWAKLEHVINTHIKPQQYGLQVKGDIFHRVEEFWQIRANQFRVLCCLDKNRRQKLILLHLFKKKSNDTPPDEIRTARNSETAYYKGNHHSKE